MTNKFSVFTKNYNKSLKWISKNLVFIKMTINKIAKILNKDKNWKILKFNKNNIFNKMIIRNSKITRKSITIILISIKLHRKLIKVKVLKDYLIIKDNNKITLFKKTLKKLKHLSNYLLNKIKNLKITKKYLYQKSMKMNINMNKIHK